MIVPFAQHVDGVVKEQKAPDTVGDTRSAVPDLPQDASTGEFCIAR